MDKARSQIEPAMELRGPRLLLRTPRPQDYEDVRRMLSDSTTMRYLRYMAKSPGGWSLEEVAERHAIWEKIQLKGEGAYFSVFQNLPTATFVGQCSFNTIDMTHRKARFGIILHHPFWRNGFGLECHDICFRFGFETLGLHRIDAETSEDNRAMCRLYEAVGIRQECLHREDCFDDGRFHNSAVFALLEQEWPAVKARMRALLEPKIRLTASRNGSSTAPP